MAKKKETEVAADPVIETQSLAVRAEAVLPSLVGASPEITARMLEVQDNLESVESFRLPRTKMTSDGFQFSEDEAPIKEITGVIIHTKKSNVYYAKSYVPGEVSPPDCFSLDGVTPDKSVKTPVNATCKGCPMAEFGTNSMKSGKACRNLKPLYLLLSDEAIMPRQLTITPASLKAANQYLMDLTERGLAYRKVKTKITAYKDNPRDTYLKLKFSMVGKLDEQMQKNVEFLKNQWRPIMDNQTVEQREFETEQAPQAQPSGEY